MSKVKDWIRKWLIEEETDYSAKKSRDLKSVCFESKDPLGGEKYVDNSIHLMEWVNGEGYEVYYTSYNQISKQVTDKHHSLSRDDVELLVAALDDMGFFD